MHPHKQVLRGAMERPPRAPSRHPTLAPQARDSLNPEAAQQQAAALHHQHAVFHRLVQWVREEHLDVHGLLHPGLVQHLRGDRLTGSGPGC